MAARHAVHKAAREEAASKAEKKVAAEKKSAAKKAAKKKTAMKMAAKKKVAKKKATVQLTAGQTRMDLKAVQMTKKNTSLARARDKMKKALLAAQKKNLAELERNLLSAKTLAQMRKARELFKAKRVALHHAEELMAA